MGHNNVCMSQLVGPFKANEELFDKVLANSNEDAGYISHLGIQTDKDRIVYINDEAVQIGRTGIYELVNCAVTSLSFAEDTDRYTIIDYTIYLDKVF